MSILENLEQIIQNLNLLINDVWKLVLFETAIQDNSMLVVIWSMVFYFVALFISSNTFSLLSDLSLNNLLV